MVYPRCKMRQKCFSYAKIVDRKTSMAGWRTPAMRARLRSVSSALRRAAAAYAIYGPTPLVHQQRDSHAYCSQSRCLCESSEMHMHTRVTPGCACTCVPCSFSGDTCVDRPDACVHLCLAFVTILNSCSRSRDIMHVIHKADPEKLLLTCFYC